LRLRWPERSCIRAFASAVGACALGGRSRGEAHFRCCKAKFGALLRGRSTNHGVPAGRPGRVDLSES
jgi:hypothetical protein